MLVDSESKQGSLPAQSRLDCNIEVVQSANTCLVSPPAVWVRLSRDSDVGRVNGAFKDIEAFRDAVKDKFPNALRHCDANQLRVFVSKEEYEREKAALSEADKHEEPQGIAPYHQIPPDAGTTFETPLYVVVPPLPGWLLLLSGVYSCFMPSYLVVLFAHCLPPPYTITVSLCCLCLRPASLDYVYLNRYLLVGCAVALLAHFESVSCSAGELMSSVLVPTVMPPPAEVAFYLPFVNRESELINVARILLKNINTDSQTAKQSKAHSGNSCSDLWFWQDLLWAEFFACTEAS